MKLRIKTPASIAFTSMHGILCKRHLVTNSIARVPLSVLHTPHFEIITLGLYGFLQIYKIIKMSRLMDGYTHTVSTSAMLTDGHVHADLFNPLTPTAAIWVQLKSILCQTGLSRRL